MNGLQTDAKVGADPETDAKILFAVGWRYKFAIVHDQVFAHGALYLERRMIEFLGYSLRYHVFHASDPDRALHDHPWWFVTFPLDGYWEQLPEGWRWKYDYVRRRRFHFRPAEYRHRVLAYDINDLFAGTRRIRTLVLAGRRTRSWGFWPKGQFVPWREYLEADQ